MQRDDALCPLCGGVMPLALEYPGTGYRRCAGCSFLSKNAPIPCYSAEYFDSYPGVDGPYDESPRNRRREADVRVRWIKANGGAGRALMEIGAASGYFVAAARKHGLAATGIEPSAATAKSASHINNVSITAMSLDELANTKSRFQCVCLWHVLEHLPDPDKQVHTLLNLLEPGGFLFAEVPNERSANARHFREKWRPLDPENHLCHYGPKSLRHLFTQGGFEVVSVSTHRGTSYLPLQLRSIPVGAACYLSDSIRAKQLLPKDPDRFDLLRLVARNPADLHL